MKQTSSATDVIPIRTRQLTGLRLATSNSRVAIGAIIGSSEQSGAGAFLCDPAQFCKNFAGPQFQERQEKLASGSCQFILLDMSKERMFVLIAALFLASNTFTAEPEEILLWRDGAPGSEGKPEKDIVIVNRNGERSIYGVHRPSITPFLPTKETASGAAVLVIPGGGHRVLAWDHEGPNLAKWLSERGVAAFVLKYRLARETNSTYKLEVHPLADTRKAMEMIRARAGEWGIDPKKVGVAGFSAGGELTAMAAGNFDFGDIKVEPASETSKPAFQALIYPGKSRQIIPNKESPPVFLACAYDDRPDISEGLAELYLRFKKVGARAELHIYSTGGHGFGVRESNQKPAGQWTERFLEWMKDSGFVPKN